MLKYLKQWFQAVMIQQFVMGRNVNPIINENEENSPNVSSTLPDSSARNPTGNILNRVDPREMPRPMRDNELCVNKKKSLKNSTEEMKNKISEKILRCWVKRVIQDEDTKNFEIFSDIEQKKGEEKKCSKEEICRCENCSFIVSTFGECAVCLEALQTRGIRSCVICANIVCSICSERLKNCAFCRSSLPMEKNRAVERMIDGLFMPCINARNGCRRMLNSETRSRHEANCDRATVGCPVSRICNWRGSPASILNHLKKAHDLEPLTDKGIAMEISSFRQKVMNKQREYTIYLSCYGQLFTVKIVLCRKKMILSFSQLGYVTRITEKIASKKYGVLIRIDVAGKQIRGALPFGKFDREIRDIAVNCEKLFSTREDISNDVDNVKIEIYIKEMNPTLKK